MNTIHESFKHGKNFKIGRFCIIEEGVIVGDDVEVRNYVTLQKGTRVDNRVYLGSYFRSGGDGEVIGSDVVIKCRATTSPGTRIYGGAFIGPHALILHKTHDGDHLPVRIGVGVYIGASATVGPGVAIGAGAIIGAGAFVSKNCGPGKTYVGVPAKELKR